MKQIIIIIFFSIFMVSCGGGGGSAAAPTQPPPAALPDPTINIIFQNNVIVAFETTIDASTSVSNNNKPLSYSWRLLTKPSASNLTLTSISNSAISITPDKVGTYELDVEVFESNSETSTKKITLFVGNNSPTSIIKQSLEYITVDEQVNFSAAESLDPDGHAINYSWVLKNKPQSSNLEINSQQALEQIEVFPDVVGEYELELIVSDSFDNTTSSILFEVVANPSEYSIYPIDFIPQYSAYNPLFEKLYLLDSEQPYLYVFDLTTRLLDKIRLPDRGNVISFSRDNTKAVVSVNSEIVFINLLNNTVLNKINTELPAGYLVYRESDIAIFPSATFAYNQDNFQIRFATETNLIQRERDPITGILLNNDTRGGTITNYSKVDDVIHTLDELVGNIKRYVPGNGKVLEKYSLPISAGVENGGNSWFNPVGNKIWITNDGNVLTEMGNLFNPNYTGLEQNQSDLLLRRLYFGELYGYPFVQSVAHDYNAVNFLVAINFRASNVDDTKIYTVNYETFEPGISYQLPPVYSSEGQVWPIYPHQLFPGTEEATHIALSYIDFRSGLTHPYVIAVYENGKVIENKTPIIDTSHLQITNTNSQYSISTNDTVFSYRDGSLNYELIKPSQSTASLTKDSSEDLYITPDITGLYEVIISSVNNFGESLKTYINFWSHEPYEVNATALDGFWIDSVYDEINDNVYVITSTKKLYKINGSTLESSELIIDEIELFQIQTSPDGQHLILSAGFDIYIYSSVDMSLLRKFNIGYAANDIIFIDNENFFVSTKSYAGLNFEYKTLKMSLLTGEIFTQQIMSNKECVFQNVNNRMICIDPPGYTPEVLRSFNILDSSIEDTYLFTFHNDTSKYSNESGLQISPDQKHVITNGGMVYHLLETFDFEKDFLYFKRLDPRAQISASQRIEWSQSGKFIYRSNYKENYTRPELDTYIHRFDFSDMLRKEKVKTPNSLGGEKMLPFKVHSGKDDDNFFGITCTEYEFGNCELVKFSRAGL